MDPANGKIRQPRRKARAHTLHWLIGLGLPGLFGIAVDDSSPIPLPLPGCTDLLLHWIVSHRSGHPVELTFSPSRYTLMRKLLPAP